jgi:internalin A
MSNLAQQRIREAKEKKLTRLDIGNCGLTEIPDEVFELTWLEELILRGDDDYIEESGEEPVEGEEDDYQYMTEEQLIKRIEFISPKIKELSQLRELDFKNTYVRDLSSLTTLTQLQTLNISSTRVLDLMLLKDLVSLKRLNISNTEVHDLSPLKNLTQLQELDIGRSEVHDLTPLKNLLQLQILNALGTNVKDLMPLKNLRHLQRLTILDTQVRDLSPIQELTELLLLDVSITQVSDLTPLRNLTKLRLLEFSNTQVSDLTPLKNLSELTSLGIHATNVSDLTPLKNLTKLNGLYIHDTNVNDLSPLKRIIEKGVPVKDISFDITDGIHVADCPLTNPPIEIVKQGNAAILRYWEEEERMGKKKVNEARLLLVGQGNTGKTTLKDKLINRNAAMPEPDATTKGIVIEPIIHENTEGSDFTVQVWDFGGQNIQKYAHQFFMSDSVVYAVLSNTREQNPNFQYWLNIIELLGKESPFFIVQNEKDGHREPLTNITQIQERFPQTFKGMLQVNLKDAATDPRFEIIEKSLFYAATQLPHTQKEYLTSFVNVRQQLDTLSQTAQSIPFKQFKDLCKAEGIEDVELINDYARTFTLLGIALHFADDVFLKSQVFLRPKWIIDALFALLYAPSVEQQSGRFSAKDVAHIWTDDDYEGMHGILLQLMEKFYLCYAIPHSTDYIVPQRLPVREEPFVPPTDATHILYRYKFLPSGLLTQLTCRLHTRIEGEKVWNDAVQFHAKDSDGRVFVRENNADNQIEVFGFGSHKADLINQVIDIMDDIHDNSKLEGLKKRLEKLVPCPCSTCATARERKEEPMFFNYNFLIELLRDGETESDRCTLSKKRFPIKTILKHASIRLFKMDTIKDLLIADKVEEALKILRGQFREDDEVIVQLSRLSHIKREHRMGQIMDAAYSAERNKLVKAVLEMLAEWNGEN